MVRLYRESKEKQMNEKIRGMEPLKRENVSYPVNESKRAETALNSDAAHHSSVQLLAYQIHNEKGGSALDNWLEAERILRNKNNK